MTTCRQRDIALVPFPFSDLSANKVRPVLILSNDEYNDRSADVLVCGITTNLANTPYSVVITAENVEQSGTLRHTSKIKADTLASLEKTLLLKTIARLSPGVFDRVLSEIRRLIQPS